MKNAIKLLGIIALVAVIGFSMVSCDDGGGPGGPSGAAKLDFSGQQVYNDDFDWDTFKVTYTKFDGNLAITDGGLGGTGSIAAGKLNYKLETAPPAGSLLPASAMIEDLEDMYTNVKFTPSTVNFAMLEGFGVGGSDYDSLVKEYFSMKQSTTSFSMNQVGVFYIYVDADVTVTAKGVTEKDDYDEDGFEISQEHTMRDINMKLKKGWNAVNSKYTSSISYSLSTMKGKETSTVQVSTGDPSEARWVLYEDYYGGYSIKGPMAQRRAAFKFSK